MSPGHTTERVYKALKSQIMLGQRPPGERLDPARLARELNASATPVRDALHQLLGERIVLAVPQQGFQVPVLSETGLRELYGWSSDLLSILLRVWRGSAGAALVPRRGGGDVAEAVADLFDAVALTLGTGEHRRAVRLASDRLHYVRAIEPAVLAETDSEADGLIEAWLEQSTANLKARLQRYHRRRLQMVPQIAAKLIAAS